MKFMAHLKCTLIYIRTVKHVKCMAFSPHTFMAIKCSSKFYLPSRGPDLTKIKTVPKRERGVHFARYFTTLIQARLGGDNRRQQGKVGLEYEISKTKSKKHFVSDDVREVKKASKEAGSVRWSRPAFMRIVSVNRWTRWSLPTTKRAIGRKDGWRVGFARALARIQNKRGGHRRMPCRRCSSAAVQRWGRESIIKMANRRRRLHHFGPVFQEPLRQYVQVVSEWFYRPEVEKRVSMSSAAARARYISIDTPLSRSA